jgi:hypothetical protein
MFERFFEVQAFEILLTALRFIPNAFGIHLVFIHRIKFKVFFKPATL